jgi:lipooligosaccharide transport system ATP-binding protein
MSSSTACVVQARGLEKRFGDRLAVAGLDLDVPEGACFGVLGPNGAGKTTTLRMVYGVSRPTRGELRVFGLDVTREGRKVRARLGVTLQENVLVESLTPAQNLRVFGRYHLLREPELSRRVDRLIEELELGSHRDVPAGALSGGFKRRMAIAMALLGNPELLILDEPTTGLDPAVRIALWNTVRELQKRGTSVLLTTHYMDEAQRLCDRILIMSQGKAVCEGAPLSLVHERVGRDVLELECTSDEERALIAGDAAFKTLRVGPRLYLFGEGPLLVQRLTRLASERNRPFVLRPANLEDLFLAATGVSLEASPE